MKKLMKILAFLVLFTAVAVGVTYGLIQFELAKQTPKPEPAPAEAGIDLHGTYDQNDLLFTEVAEENGDVRITYPQIDGLKDAVVETAINDMIAARVEEIKSYHEGNGASISYLTYQIYGNFSNALSIGLFSADGKQNSRQDFLNIDLNDGSLIELSDLFCVGADIQSAVRTGFYETLTRYNLSPDYWEAVSAPDENELYRVVRGYLAGEQRFLFTAAEIYLYFEEYTASVPMIDFAEDIAVYHRFLSNESLFERDDIGYKSIFTCAGIPEGYVQREYGFVGDNFWYDIGMQEQYVDESVSSQIHESVTAYTDGVFEGLMDEVQTLAETAKANPDRAYILLAEPSVYLYSASEYLGGQWDILPSKAVTVNENYVLYEMSYDLFEGKYRDALVALYRNEPYSLFYFGIDEYIEGNEVTVTARRTERMDLYETGEEVTLDTLFVSGCDYDSHIRAQAKYDLMAYYNCTLEEAEQMAQSVTYTLEGTGLRLRLPDWGEEQFLWMALNDFDRDHLTIFQ